jgi:hypothetical protein
VIGEARRPAARLFVSLIVVAAVGLTAAGCSSSPSKSASASSTTAKATPGPKSSTSTTKTHTSTSTTPSKSATSLPPSGTATCQPKQLSLGTQTSNGAAGTISLVVTMTNTSAATCTLDGYPGMLLLDAQGIDLPTDVIRGGVASIPGGPATQPASLVTLAPTAGAAFSLSYEDVPTGTETSCPTSAKAEITPPNDTAYAVMTLQLTACSGGTVHVSPVYAAPAES